MDGPAVAAGRHGAFSPGENVTKNKKDGNMTKKKEKLSETDNSNEKFGKITTKKVLEK